MRLIPIYISFRINANNLITRNGESNASASDYGRVASIKRARTWIEITQARAQKQARPNFWPPNMAALQPNWLLSHRSSRGTRARYTRSARVTLRDRVQSDSLRASLSLYSPWNSFSLSSASPSRTYARFRRARSHREIRGFKVEWVMQVFACRVLSCGFYRFENYRSNGNFVNFNWTMDLRNFLLCADVNKPRIRRIRIRSNTSTFRSIILLVSRSSCSVSAALVNFVSTAPRCSEKWWDILNLPWDIQYVQ